jgi:hypothetical protein
LDLLSEATHCSVSHASLTLTGKGFSGARRSDADHVVMGDEEVKEWDLPLGVADTMAAAVEHQEYREAAARLRS